MNRLPLLRWWIGVLACAAIASGCTPSLTPAMAVDPVERTLSQLEQPQVRKRLADVMATPEVQRTMRESSAAFAQGAVQGLTNEELTKRMETLAERVTAAVVASLARGMENDLAPASAAVTRASVEAAMRAAFSREATDGAARLASDVGARAARATIQASADEIPATLAPALKKALIESVGPAIEIVLRENVAKAVEDLGNAPALQRALGSTSRLVAREVVFGTNEALADMEQQKPKRGLIASIAGLVDYKVWVAVLGVVGLLVAVWLVARRRRVRVEEERAAQERRLQDVILLTLQSVLRSSDESPARLREIMHGRIDEAMRKSTPAVDGVHRNGGR